MFCYDKVGAQASANLFSLVMTARANGLEPFEYLSEVFQQLPLATTVEAIEALNCRLTVNSTIAMAVKKRHSKIQRA